MMTMTVEEHGDKKHEDDSNKHGANKDDDSEEHGGK